MIRNFPLSLILSASVAVVTCDQAPPNEETSAMEQRIQRLEERASKDLGAHSPSPERKQLRPNGKQLFAPGGKKLPLEGESPLAGREAGAFAKPFDASNGRVDYQFFSDALSPHGTWYETAEYGAVWQPAVSREAGWRPYTRGQWVCSDRGWTWVSTEPFGWATFHYGRWALLQNQGWIWVPGTEWAPNWCTWRSNKKYIGWAPLPPETLAFQDSEWDSRVEGQYGIAASCFNFVETCHFDHIISPYCLPANQNPSCLKVTTNITRFQIRGGQIFCGGPGLHDLSKRLGRKLRYYQIQRSTHSYDHRYPAYLQCRFRGERLIVAAPTVQKTRPIIAHNRLTEVKVERNEAIDPQVLEAYRQMRKREHQPRAIVRTAPESSIRRRPGVRQTVSLTENSTIPGNSAAQAKDVRVQNVLRPLNPRPTRMDSEAIRAKDRQKAEAQLRAFREMARGQREIARAERARREQLEIAANTQREEIARQQQQSQEAELQKEAIQQTQRKELQRRGQEEAQQKQRDEQEGERVAAQQRQDEETQRRQQEEARQKQLDEQELQKAEEQRRQHEEAQRRSQEQALRRQRDEQQRQRAEDQRRQSEAQQRQKEEAQRKQREETQRRSQEEARRSEQQREQGQRAQRGK